MAVELIVKGPGPDRLADSRYIGLHGRAGGFFPIEPRQSLPDVRSKESALGTAIDMLNRAAPMAAFLRFKNLNEAPVRQLAKAAANMGEFGHALVAGLLDGLDELRGAERP